MKILPNGLSVSDHRSLLAIERAATEIIIQCRYLRKNALAGHEDRGRFYLITQCCETAVTESRKGEKRLEKSEEVKHGLVINTSRGGEGG